MKSSGIWLLWKKRGNIAMSISIVSGKLTELVTFLIIAAAALYYLWIAIKGKILDLRPLPQFEAVSDGVDKAVEEGHPVYVTIGGYAYLSGLYATMAISGLNVLRYTIKMCVRRGASVHIPVPRQPEAYALMDGIYREVCVSEGKPEVYNMDNVQFYGSNEAYYTGIAGWIARDGCSMYMMIGAAGGGIDTIPLHWAYNAGALRIGGTPRWPHQGTFTLLNDYPLWMDDVYAMGAKCSEDPVVVSTQGGADVGKFILVVLLIATAILAAAKVPIISWLNM